MEAACNNTEKSYRIVLITFIPQLLDRCLSVLNPHNVDVGAIITLPMLENESVVKKHQLDCPLVPYWQMKECLEQMYFDYIFICDGITSEYNGQEGSPPEVENDLLNLNVEKNKIVNLMALYNSQIYNLANPMRHYLNTNNNYELFITGLSYAEVGIDATGFDFPAINFACSSQDLFFDYEITKLILTKGNSRFKKALIGLAPYSFHYDLSYTNDRHRILGYYPVVKNAHNYSLSNRDIELIFNDLFKGIYNRIDAQLNIELVKNKNENRMDIHQCLAARRHAESWNYKDYPATVVENKKILKELLLLCRKNDIIPIVVLFPFTSIWRKFFARKKIDQLYHILKDMAKEVPFEFLNYYDSPHFADTDFYDVEHLNIYGAQKMTELIKADLGVLSNRG